MNEEPIGLEIPRIEPDEKAANPKLEKPQSDKEKEKMKKILIVENNSSDFDLMNFALKKVAEVIWAKSLEEGKKFFNENKDAVDLIIMDACVNNEENPDSINLVQEIIASGYNKPITASSSNRYNSVLMKAGATHNGEGKGTAALLARKLL